MSILGFLFGDPPFTSTKSQVAILSQRGDLLARRMLSVRSKRRGEVDALRTAVARLMLIVETQHRMLLKKGVCTSPEFEALLHEVDVEDGAADGQRKHP